MISAWLCLSSLVLFAAIAFGVRSWLLCRRTGATGFRGLSGSVGSPEWLGGALLIVAIVLAAASPAVVLAGLIAPARLPYIVTVAGVGLMALGFVGTIAAQLTMGDSWRVGVDEREATTLIDRGPFRIARNPIFASMLIFLVGLALVLPTVVSAAAFAAALVGLELQVRLVEEPYLMRTHGETYARYASRVGRFVPLLGRVRTTSTRSLDRRRASLLVSGRESCAPSDARDETRAAGFGSQVDPRKPAQARTPPPPPPHRVTTPTASRSP
ncbi:MAG: hypothetical protein A2138_17210 [Deltaproteobacteria bacterium RBG_16_71_12]|nr:MAG: hypothetical protein A2138_17210 [Deltaproteobacteria bacterium RBG_16_71_12]